MRSEVADRPVRIPADAYEAARRIAARAARDGWRSVGVDRDDPPTICAVVREAILRFDSAAKAKRA